MTTVACSGGTHVTPPGATSCCCGDVVRVAAQPADSELRDALKQAFLAIEVSSRTYPDVLAGAALAVFAPHLGQQQAAIERVKALADELDSLYGGSGEYGLGVESANGLAAARIRAALGSDL